MCGHGAGAMLEGGGVGWTEGGLVMDPLLGRLVVDIGPSTARTDWMDFSGFDVYIIHSQGTCSGLGVFD